jgi:hypothetical protein
MPIRGRKKTTEELRRLMELRRSSASGAVPSKRHYSRSKAKQEERRDVQDKP